MSYSSAAGRGVRCDQPADCQYPKCGCEYIGIAALPADPDGQSTMRDRFAAFALMGLIASDAKAGADEVVDVQERAYLAYDYADAMLKARKP